MTNHDIPSSTDRRAAARTRRRLRTVGLAAFAALAVSACYQQPYIGEPLAENSARQIRAGDGEPSLNGSSVSGWRLINDDTDLDETTCPTAEGQLLRVGYFGYEVAGHPAARLVATHDRQDDADDATFEVTEADGSTSTHRVTFNHLSFDRLDLEVSEIDGTAPPLGTSYRRCFT